jgi:hypothetical protein
MNKDLVGSFAWGLGIVLLALVCRQLRAMEYIEGETVTRVVIGATGLMAAWFGNRMPETFAPLPWARRARRVGGWSWPSVASSTRLCGHSRRSRRRCGWEVSQSCRESP